LARRYVEDHPLALNLDIDQVCGLLGRWPDQPIRAGLLARDLSLAMAGVHLAAGHDVVIPQYIGDTALRGYRFPRPMPHTSPSGPARDSASAAWGGSAAAGGGLRAFSVSGCGIDSAGSTPGRHAAVGP